jgi:hypothetical protein
MLRRLLLSPSLAERHTVGLLDTIREADCAADAPNDGLPGTLEAVLVRYGHRHFKLKLSGKTVGDLARLREISDRISTRAEVVTLDGNEQYADAASFPDFLDQFEAAPVPATLWRKAAFVENLYGAARRCTAMCRPWPNASHCWWTSRTAPCTLSLRRVPWAIPARAARACTSPSSMPLAAHSGRLSKAGLSFSQART